MELWCLLFSLGTLCTFWSYEQSLHHCFNLYLWRERSRAYEKNISAWQNWIEFFLKKRKAAKFVKIVAVIWLSWFLKVNNMLSNHSSLFLDFLFHISKLIFKYARVLFSTFLLYVDNCVQYVQHGGLHNIRVVNLLTKSTPHKLAPFCCQECVLYCDLFIASVFGCSSAVQASIEFVEMTELQHSLCRGWISEPGTIEAENESGITRVRGVVAHLKDRYHTVWAESGTALDRGQWGVADKDTKYPLIPTCLQL